MRYRFIVFIAVVGALLFNCEGKRRETTTTAESESAETFGAYQAVLSGSTRTMYARMIFAQLAPELTDEMSRRTLPRGGSLGTYVDRDGHHIGFVMFGPDLLNLYTLRDNKYVLAAPMNVTDGDGTVGEWQRAHREWLAKFVEDLYDGKNVPGQR